MSNVFRTFQTVNRYEDALVRHGQWIRWTQALKCACVNSDTMQPDPSCDVCQGRGKIYREPSQFQILDERVKHDGRGRLFPKNTPVVPGLARVYRKGVSVPLAASQPADGSYIQIDPPFPEPYRILEATYFFTTDVSVTGENSTVYSETAFILRIIAGRFDERGKSFEGSIKSVSRVYNVTKDETYTVATISKEFITLTGLGTWTIGDVLEVDYVYVKPFDFMLTGVSGRLRYEQPYVLDEADATLVTPYWAQPAPEDLFTALAQEQLGAVIIQPVSPTANDVITASFDLSRLLRVIDSAGMDYSVGPGNDVQLFGRDELQWNVTKPTIPYTVQYTFHPTYTALTNLHTLRNSENKAFVNRVSVKLFDRLNGKETF